MESLIKFAHRERFLQPFSLFSSVSFYLSPSLPLCRLPQTMPSYYAYRRQWSNLESFHRYVLDIHFFLIVTFFFVFFLVKTTEKPFSKDLNSLSLSLLIKIDCDSENIGNKSFRGKFIDWNYVNLWNCADVGWKEPNGHLCKKVAVDDIRFWLVNMMFTRCCSSYRDGQLSSSEEKVLRLPRMFVKACCWCLGRNLADILSWEEHWSFFQTILSFFKIFHQKLSMHFFKKLKLFQVVWAKSFLLEDKKIFQKLFRRKSFFSRESSETIKALVELWIWIFDSESWTFTLSAKSFWIKNLKTSLFHLWN